MRKSWFRNQFIVSLAMIVALAAAPIAAYMQPAQAQTSTPERQTTATSRQATAQSATSEKQATAKTTHLVDAKLKACQQREKAITNIMSRLSDRGTKQLDVFGKISDRTKVFYVKSGKTLSNYAALVSNVASAKADAESAVASVKASSTSFTCDGTDPKGVAASFQANVKTEIVALNKYKAAIKNLIVGVKSVQGTSTSSTSKSTSTDATDGSKQ